MNEVIQTLLLYGKAPAIRVVITLLMGWLGRYGLNQQTATGWSEAIVSGVVTFLLWAWAAYDKRNMHELPAPPPTDQPKGTP